MSCREAIRQAYGTFDTDAQRVLERCTNSLATFTARAMLERHPSPGRGSSGAMASTGPGRMSYACSTPLGSGIRQ